MITFINPNKLTPELANMLLEFFEYQTTQNERVFWEKSKAYKCQDGNELVFSNSVVQRKCSKRENYKGVRYEFISDVFLGKGSFSAVYEIEGTLAIDKDSFKYKLAGSHKNKTRAVKIHNMEKVSDKDVEAEYEITKRSGYLAIKKPVSIGNNKTLSVMKKINGRILNGIINDDISNIKNLTTQQRLDITRAVLLALKEQVTDKGIIHRDIKPENISVDMNKPITATIFDFGFGIDKDKPDDKSPGSEAYAAPEIFEETAHTVKTDVFSMARVIALVWRVNTKSYKFKLPEEYRLNSKNVDLLDLFKGINNLEKDDKSTIRSALEAMLLCNEDKRVSIDTAIEMFNKVTYPNKPPQIAQSQQSVQSTVATNNVSISALPGLFSSSSNSNMLASLKINDADGTSVDNSCKK